MGTADDDSSDDTVTGKQSERGRSGHEGRAPHPQLMVTI